jgi:hypothetical protein
MTTPRPPAELAALADVVGAEGTLALIETHGGTRLYVPKLQANADMIALVGATQAEALSRAIGGNTVKVPLAKRWRCLVYRSRGLTYRQIALKLNITEDIVHRWLKRADMTNKQFSLAV